MKVFTCNDFSGHYPVGTAAVIVARTMKLAERELRDELASRGLSGSFTLTELDLNKTQVVILNDGDY